MTCPRCGTVHPDAVGLAGAVQCAEARTDDDSLLAELRLLRASVDATPPQLEGRYTSQGGEATSGRRYPE